MLLDNRYCPKKIEVRTEEVYLLLEQFCKDVGITMKQVKHLPAVDAVVEMFSGLTDESPAQV